MKPKIINKHLLNDINSENQLTEDRNLGLREKGAWYEKMERGVEREREGEISPAKVAGERRAVAGER